MSSDRKKKSGVTPELTRRVALARLGIGVALAYSAPIIVHLDRSANATLSSTPCGRGKRKPRWCRGKDRDDDRGDGRGKGKDRGKDRDDDRRSRRRSGRN